MNVCKAPPFHYQYNSEENKTTAIEYTTLLQNNSSFICNSLSLAVLADMKHQHMSSTHNNHLQVVSEEHHTPYIHKNWHESSDILSFSSCPHSGHLIVDSISIFIFPHQKIQIRVT